MRARPAIRPAPQRDSNPCRWAGPRRAGGRGPSGRTSGRGLADAPDDLRDEVLAFLGRDADDLLVLGVGVLRSAEAIPGDRRHSVAIDALARHCAERLEERLARPPRPDDDWSIELVSRCDCRVCDVLGGFLADPVRIRQTFEWPLAKEGRRHVHGMLESAELPVLHQTRRTGRPYTLVMTKTEALFEGARAARRRDGEDLAWLQRQHLVAVPRRPAVSGWRAPRSPRRPAAPRPG